MSLFTRLLRGHRPAPAPQPESSPSAAEPPAPDRAAIAAQRAAAEEQALAAALTAADETALANLVVAGAATRIRQRAAEAIGDPARLRELIRATRGGKDKQVYRILTAKRDALLAEQRSSEQLAAEIDAAGAAIERHSLRPYDALFTATLEHLEGRWRAVADHARAELREQVGQHLARGREVIQRHRERLEAESVRERSVAEAKEEQRRRRESQREAAAAAAAEQARAEETERLAHLERQRAEEAALRTVVSLARRALAALERGSSARAARLRSLVLEQLPAAPALPGWVANLLQQLDGRLEELKDWRSFTIGPKRVELLREVESLIGSELPRPELARRIKELQLSWRTLARGAGDDLEADRVRFREAAARAYEPCREYFAQQAKLRQANLQRREELLERLKVFADEQSAGAPNVHRIMQVLVDARRQWRRYSPVDWASVKALGKRFEALAGSLQSRIDTEYERNIQEKRALITRAEQLLNEPDTRAGIDQVKALQLKWQEIGLAPREQERALWAEFRQHCDAVYARREQESAAYRESLEANRTRAIALCEAVEAIAVLPGPQLLDAATGLGALRAEFDALELPKAAARALRERFARATDCGASAVAREKARLARRVWTDLFEVANSLNGYALAVARQSDPADLTARRARAATGIAARQDWPKGAGAILVQQLTKTDAGSQPGDFAANEVALRRLCMRAEVCSDLPTPAEDQALRREYQLQRLVQSMGQGAITDPAELDALALEWIAAGPVEEKTYTRLLERFERCRDAVPGGVDETAPDA